MEPVSLLVSEAPLRLCLYLSLCQRRPILSNHATKESELLAFCSENSVVDHAAPQAGLCDAVSGTWTPSAGVAGNDTRPM